ncbi:esterase [Variovorax boronicumulans]|uniref:Esterase n=1 Tax=Variovorax boronicumulans TaxID=436515 RepID=A0A250DMI7_9BURK|nr:alpha/beta hydrolase [Variovorax boronicumulans]ATA55588.1 esterase [Variovorax boronicumulans]
MQDSINSEARAKAYSPSSVAPDFAKTIAEYESLSVLASKRHPSREIGYGDSPDEKAILFEAKSASPPPLLVFIHGGYWQELSARVSCFPALQCVDEGISYAAIDYTLAPHASLGTIVGQCIRAVRTLCAFYRRRHPGARIVIAGSSAGAHLAAMLLAALDDIDAPLQGAVLLSGVYDLQPLVGTYINDKLGLDAPAALRLSPLFLPVTAHVPAVVCWGENETEAFKRQSRDYAARIAANGRMASVYEVVGRNHFDIVFDLCDPATRLGRDTFQLLRGTP